MTNPYRIEGPACISFSGGRTSAYMLRQILDAHGGTLPTDVHVTFANTGKERPETLDFVRECGDRWGVLIHWIEYQTDAPKFRDVNHDSAARNGEPFTALVRSRGYLPNPVTRLCTADLKIKPMRRWMSAQGYDHWTVIIGLRYDEPARVAKISAPSRERFTREAPLYRAKVTKADVLAFWAAQPFDLHLQQHEGNCDLCFLKGINKRLRIMRDRPDLAEWWIERERETGGTFRNPDNEPRGYAGAMEIVRHLPMLPGIDDDDSIDCACTD